MNDGLSGKLRTLFVFVFVLFLFSNLSYFLFERGSGNSNTENQRERERETDSEFWRHKRCSENSETLSFCKILDFVPSSLFNLKSVYFQNFNFEFPAAKVYALDLVIRVLVLIQQQAFFAQPAPFGNSRFTSD